jgi:asparagine synthase (glutamine-hydrolysing)
MHLSEPHLLAFTNGKTCCKVLLSGEGADELMGGYTRYKALQHPSLLHVITLLGNFDLFSKPLHNKLLRFAQIQKKSDLVLFNGSKYLKDIATTLDRKTPTNEYRKKYTKKQNHCIQIVFGDKHFTLTNILIYAPF